MSHENNKIYTKIREQDCSYGADEVSILLDYYASGDKLWVDITDDRFSHFQAVAMEIWQGELRVVVWADAEQEDPTHIIPIEPMSEEFRKEYERDFEDGRQKISTE